MDLFPINDLPEEVLLHIFSLLSVPDRLKVCLVCKKWFNIMNCKYFLRNVVVQISDLIEITDIKLSRNFLNFFFRFVLFDYIHYEFLRHISSVIECISFERCEMRALKKPISFDDVSFENLKVLKVIDCDLWILFPNLPNLTELYLSGTSIITDDGLAILQRSMKNLRTLSLYCPVSFDPKAYKRFYAHNVSYEENPSPYILSLPALKSFISERANTLKELNFYFNVNSRGLKEISGIKNLCLNKVSLEMCRNCIKSINTLFKNQPSLKSLNLNGIMGLSRDNIKSLCNLLPNLEELEMSHGSLTDDSFGCVFQLIKLKKLNVSSCYASEMGFCRDLENFKSTQLQSLDVSGLKVANIDLLIHKCKNLVNLNLAYCLITDELLHFISENLIHLQDLNLKHTDITDYGLTGETEVSLNKTEVQVGQNIHKPLSNLKVLKKLDLTHCEKITDFGIVFAIRFQYLEYLTLTGCHIKFYDTIESLLNENPNLSKVSRAVLKDGSSLFPWILLADNAGWMYGIIEYDIIEKY